MNSDGFSFSFALLFICYHEPAAYTFPTAFIVGLFSGKLIRHEKNLRFKIGWKL